MMMVWALLENTLTPEFLDDIFARSAIKQYTRKLLFSEVVGMMSAVVTRVGASIHDIFKKSAGECNVSLTSHYNKLNGIELTTCIMLVREVAVKLKGLIEAMGGKPPVVVEGFQTRIIDGNALGATQHRLKVLRNTRSGPLPGKSLVILDADHELAVDMVPHEDGHAGERSMFDTVLNLVKKGELWLADRNFCTAEFLFRLVENGAAFLIRQHASLRWNALEPLVFPEGTKIAEHRVSIPWMNGEITARRIVLRVENKTRDGDSELVLLTTLPFTLIAAQIAELYRRRWTLEKLFHMLTMTLRCEMDTLGYPKAALFAFAVALVAGNIVSAVRAAIRVVHGRKEEQSLSDYHLIRDVQSAYGVFDRTFAAMLQDQVRMPQVALVTFLLECAQRLRLEAYRKAPNRGHRTKKQRGTPEDAPHVSTARLLAAAAHRRTVAI